MLFLWLLLSEANSADIYFTESIKKNNIRSRLSNPRIIFIFIIVHIIFLLYKLSKNKVAIASHYGEYFIKI